MVGVAVAGAAATKMKSKLVDVTVPVANIGRGAVVLFLTQLPPDLAWKVGTKNAVRLYNLDRKLVCHRPGAPAAKTMWVSADALAAHSGHGDDTGPCRRS